DFGRLLREREAPVRSIDRQVQTERSLDERLLQPAAARARRDEEAAVAGRVRDRERALVAGRIGILERGHRDVDILTRAIGERRLVRLEREGVSRVRDLLAAGQAGLELAHVPLLSSQ